MLVLTRPLVHGRPGASPTTVIEISRTHNPYPRRGVQADGHGMPRYTELSGSLIAMLAHQVETGLDVEAVVEVGGQRLAYRQLWDRAARVGGGLRAAGVARGDRVSVRYRARGELGARVLGHAHGRGRGCRGRTRPPERRAAGRAAGPGDPASARTQLLQRRERQLHLRLDTLSASHPKVWRRLDRIAQHRGLAPPSTPCRSAHMPGAG